ncbi:MAG: COR domain-containing protein, partial [Bacteroidota bacterium]
NQITKIENLENLTQLSILHLNDNQITSLESLLPFIKKDYDINLDRTYIGKEISIGGNPIEIPPLEIVSEGNEAILNYFEKLEEQGKAELYEAKLLIVGEGRVGKTTLARKLINTQAKMPKEKETTKGIDIQQKAFNTPTDKDFTINIWDFGGQEIYKSTHQFFLTKRSLYILVDDTAKNESKLNDPSFSYWLQTVELFGDGSPLLLVQNEKADRSKDIDFGAMQLEFGFLKEKFRANLLTNRGLKEIWEDIKFRIQQLDHVGQALPAKWVDIRMTLDTLAIDQPYISLEKYFDICIKDHQLNNEEDALDLSQYLHDLGVFLHFQEDGTLYQTIILQNEWATNAVYKVLDDEIVKSNKGRFSKKESKRIWNESKYKRKFNELLALMLRFELCYQLPEPNTYLVPELLPASQPKGFEWDESNNLEVRYQYKFMPRGLLSRLIVRLHEYVEDPDQAWITGVVLERKHVKALVTEKLNALSIKIRGHNNKEFLIIILEAIDKLNSTFQKINVKKLIPCNCSSCKKLGSDHKNFFEHSRLEERLKFNKLTIECQNPPYKDVEVLPLLEDVSSDSYQAFTRKYLKDKPIDKSKK